MNSTVTNDTITCDGTNHYDSNGSFIESCPEAGSWPEEKIELAME